MVKRVFRTRHPIACRGHCLRLLDIPVIIRVGDRNYGGLVSGAAQRIKTARVTHPPVCFLFQLRVVQRTRRTGPSPHEFFDYGTVRVLIVFQCPKQFQRLNHYVLFFFTKCT